MINLVFDALPMNNFNYVLVFSGYFLSVTFYFDYETFLIYDYDAKVSPFQNSKHWTKILGFVCHVQTNTYSFNVHLSKVIIHSPNTC